MIDTINATGKVMVIYPFVLPVPPPLEGVGGTRALAHFIYIYVCISIAMVELLTPSIAGHIISQMWTPYPHQMWTDVVNPTRNLQLEDCLYQCTANFENRNSERPWPHGPCRNTLPEPPVNCTHHGFLFKRKEINVRQEIYVPMSILFSPTRRIGSLT